MRACSASTPMARPIASFDGDGSVSFSHGALTITLARDGKILAATSDRNFREIKRLFADGRLDSSFSFRQTFDPGPGGDDSAMGIFDLLELRDGRILFGGQDGNISIGDCIPTLWALSRQGQSLGTWRGYDDQPDSDSSAGVRQLAMSPDAQSLVALVQTDSDLFQIERYDLATGQRLSTDLLDIPGYAANARLLAGRDRACVVASVDGRLLKIDLTAEGRVAGDLAASAT